MKKFLFLGFIAATMFSLASCDLIEEANDAINEIQQYQAPAYTESDGGRTITVSQKKS